MPVHGAAARASKYFKVAAADVAALPAEEVKTHHRLGGTSSERRVLKGDLVPLLAQVGVLRARTLNALQASHCR